MTAPEVVIRAIANGGDGVATLDDGRTVFVPRAAPGDRLRLQHVRLQSRFARAEIAEIVEPGPDRVAPPCPHYVNDQCGSCQLMHLAPAVQRSAKSRIAGDALRRVGHLDASDPPIAAAPSDLRYRTKVTFAVQDGHIGYHRVNQPAHIFDVVDCLIADVALMQLHAALRAVRTLLPRDTARIVLRLDRQGGRHLIVITDSGNAWSDATALARALDDAGTAAVIWWQPPGGKARALAGAADPWPATVFEQVHPVMGDRVRHAACDALGDVAGKVVWDLYAGIGETTAALARNGARVDSVESDTRAVALAESLGPAGPRRQAALVEAVIDGLRQPAAVITNPPRTGMAPAVIAGLLKAKPDRIVYVSCDPATLARDVARLVPQYALTQVDAFDQFPQTAHLECVAVLERR